MSRKRIERYIPDAIDILDDEFKEEAIPSEYNGYIASFGASMIQSGLIPTLAFYENENSQSNKDRSVLTKVILEIFEKNNNGQQIAENSLLKYVINHQDKKRELKAKIKDAAVAIKLALRTFELDENSGDSDEEE